MLAADDKLFVVTREGRIYCFGAEKVEPQTYACKPQPPRRRDDGWATRAAAIIRAGGASEGYCVVLGIGSGRLIGELVRQSKLSVIVLEPNVKKAGAARRKCDDAGWYGGRVHVVAGDLSSVKMPPYLADLVTSEDAPAAGLDEDDALRRAFDMLRPYGGTLCLTADVRLRRRAEALGIARALVTTAGGLTTLRRMGALPGTADWSHQYGDMTNSVLSPDKTVRAPLGMLWFGGPSGIEVPDMREGEVLLSDLWYRMHEKRLAEAEGVAIDDELRERVRRDFPPPAHIDFRQDVHPGA